MRQEDKLKTKYIIYLLLFIVSCLLSISIISNKKTSNAIDMGEYYRTLNINSSMIDHTKSKYFIYNYNSSTPLISLKITFNQGTAIEPMGKEGAVRLLIDTMLRNYIDSHKTRVSNYLEDNSIDFEYGTNKDNIYFKLTFLNYYTDRALWIVYYMLNIMEITPQDLVETKQSTIRKIRSNSIDDYTYSHNKALEIAINTSWGRDQYGTSQSINSITLNDIKYIRSSIFSKDNTFFSVSGSLDSFSFSNYIKDIYNSLPDARVHNNKLIFHNIGGESFFEQKQTDKYSVMFLIPYNGDARDFNKFFTLKHYLYHRVSLISNDNYIITRIRSKVYNLHEGSFLSLYVETLNNPKEVANRIKAIIKDTYDLNYSLDEVSEVDRLIFYRNIVEKSSPQAVVDLIDEYQRYGSRSYYSYLTHISNTIDKAELDKVIKNTLHEDNILLFISQQYSK